MSRRRGSNFRSFCPDIIWVPNCFLHQICPDTLKFAQNVLYKSRLGLLRDMILRFLAPVNPYLTFIYKYTIYWDPKWLRTCIYVRTGIWVSPQNCMILSGSHLGKGHFWGPKCPDWHLGSRPIFGGPGTWYVWW